MASEHRIFSTYRPYLIAFAAVAVAIQVRWFLSPSLQWECFYSASYASVAIAVWAGGVGPGVFAAVLYYVAAHLFYVQPLDIPAADLEGAHLFAGLIYLVDCAAIVAVGEVLRRTRAKAKRDRDALNLALKAANMNTSAVELDGTRAKRCENSARFYGLLEADPGDRKVFLEHIHPEDKAKHFKILEDARRTRREFCSRYRFIRPIDGETMWVESHGRVIEDHGKAIIIGAEVNVTERVLMEERLARQAEVLKEGSTNKSRFISVLAHELRNPLAPIKTAVHLLTQDCTPAPAKARAAEVIGRQVQRMEHLIEDLLDATRIEQGKVKLRPALVDIATVFEKASEATLPSINEKKQKLILSRPSSPITVKGDDDRLVQIINNLLNNASKFTPPGGEIRLSAEAIGKYARISVKDNGAGIPREKLRQIFEAFFQLSANSGAKPGLGLGLALCKSLVEMHSGCIEAFSDGPGTGSTFSIKLPLEPARTSALAP